jgi:hypothetical protein
MWKREHARISYERTAGRPWHPSAIQRPPLSRHMGSGWNAALSWLLKSVCRARTTIGREKGRYAVSPSEVPEHGQAWTARALSAHDGWEMAGPTASGRWMPEKEPRSPGGTAFRASPREIMCTETRLKKALYHVLKHCTPLSMGDVNILRPKRSCWAMGDRQGTKTLPMFAMQIAKRPPAVGPLCWAQLQPANRHISIHRGLSACDEQKVIKEIFIRDRSPSTSNFNFTLPVLLLLYPLLTMRM